MIKRFLLLLLLLALFSAACSSAQTASDDDMNHDLETMDDDHGHADETVDRIPNENDAAIAILSPANGATFAAGEQVIVEVTTENFPLGETNNHWHVYVNGASWGMIMGGNSDYPLSGLEPGEHEIAVFMSIETHEEYAEGDAITIVVEE